MHILESARHYGSKLGQFRFQFRAHSGGLLSFFGMVGLEKVVVFSQQIPQVLGGGSKQFFVFFRPAGNHFFQFFPVFFLFLVFRVGGLPRGLVCSVLGFRVGVFQFFFGLGD